MAILARNVSKYSRNQAAVAGLMKANPNMSMVECLRLIVFSDDNGDLPADKETADFAEIFAEIASNYDDADSFMSDDRGMQIRAFMEIRPDDISGGVDADDRNARIMADNMRAAIVDSGEKLTREKLQAIAAPGQNFKNAQVKADFTLACKILLEKHGKQIRKYNKDGDLATVGRWAMLGLVEETTRIAVV